MARDIYERLAQHLDDPPAGFPRTDNGVEIRILRRLFTAEEAKLAVHLTPILEESRVIARRAKIPVEEATRRLKKMFEKGLIFCPSQQVGSKLDRFLNSRQVRMMKHYPLPMTETLIGIDLKKEK